MNRVLSSMVAVALAFAVQAAELPYDENANVAADLQRALAAAQSNRNDVLLVFGANWCPD
jgi:thioredoxin 1